jgi:hypothetical protein
VVWSLLPLCTFAGDGTEPAKFKITTKRTDDTVEVPANKQKAVFIIKSPFGISQAVIERQEHALLQWPRSDGRMKCPT